MSLKSKNLWQTALDRLEAARAQDWSDAHKAEAAWEEIKMIEKQLFKPVATIEELADKLRYLVGVSVSRANRDLPVARQPWKQRMLISAVADLDRLCKEVNRYKTLIQRMRPLEEISSQLQECQLRLEEVKAERDAARFALERFNLDLPAAAPPKPIQPPDQEPDETSKTP